MRCVADLLSSRSIQASRRRPLLPTWGHGITTPQIQHIRAQMAALNHEISKDEANLGIGYRIGHSFFTPVSPITDFRKWFQAIVRYEILPLLEEYWIDDPKMVQQFRLALTEGMP
ncbi:MAG: hypothetical protein R3F31_02120 [Verrucomicrobiales bacterium]